MAIAIDIPHTPIVSVQKSYNRSMTTENNKNSRFEMRPRCLNESATPVRLEIA